MRQKGFTPWFFLLSGLMALTLVYCGKKNFTDAELEEGAETAATEMDSLDEALAGAGAVREIFEAVEAASGRAVCRDVTFDACAANVRKRVFDNCTRANGKGTLNGTVKLTFDDAACKIDGVGEKIRREIDGTSLVFTATGGTTVTMVTTSTPTYEGHNVGGGQEIERTGARGEFKFRIKGVNAVAKTSTGTKLFDVSRETTEDITVTGEGRVNRMATGGKLVTYHNLAEFKVTWVPNNVTWEAGCRCPTGGSMTGTQEGTRTGTLTLTFTGCGTGTVTRGEETMDVTLRSCEATT